MPIHDWTRVEAGVFHSFHMNWLTRISDALNEGVLPPGFYALQEHQVAGYEADVLTFRREGFPPTGGGGTAVATALDTRFTDTAERRKSRPPVRWLAVKKAETAETVAVIEVVSPGNKISRDAFRAFVRKSADLIDRGVHLLLVDLLPPGRRDPNGMHAAVWGELTGRKFELPADARLTVASYEAGRPARAFVDPTAAGRPLPNMSLFLAPGWHVPVPLEATYMANWQRFPAAVREPLEPPCTSSQ